MTILHCLKRRASSWTRHLHTDFPFSFKVTREHQLELIIVPTLLLLGTLVILLPLLILRYCCKRQRTRVTAPSYRSSTHRHTKTHNHRHHLQGIDGKLECKRFAIICSRFHSQFSQPLIQICYSALFLTVLCLFHYYKRPLGLTHWSMKSCQWQFNRHGGTSSQPRLQYHRCPQRCIMEPSVNSLYCHCRFPSSLMTQ